MTDTLREALYTAITGVVNYRQHATGCEINQTDFCSCGLREAMERLDSAWRDYKPPKSVAAPSGWQPQGWLVKLTCCGRDAGTFHAKTWVEADAFRESYTSGPGVNPHGYSGIGPGHQRSGVIVASQAQKEGKADGD